MRHDRRTFLRALGASWAGVLAAGCSESTTEPTATDAPDTTTEPATTAPATTPTSTATEAASTETVTAASPAGDPPRSAAHHDPDDGFAEMAPWLDDDTSVYTVDEPTIESFLDAVARSEPRVVVFETSGTIDLDGRSVSINNDKLWLAGQTAPSPGITLVRGGFSIEANDCVVQHLRARPGDAGYERGDGWEPDAIRTGDGTRNNVIDHCTATWSIDEALSVGYHSTDTTVSNCLVAEPLHDATHSKGSHGYGSLIGDGAESVALMGNVWAHATSRNPRLKADTESVVVNNVMYHFDEAVNLDDSTVTSVQGNAFLRVDEGDAVVEGGNAHVDDNVTEPSTPMTNETNLVDIPPRWPEGMEAMAAADVAQHNALHVGARPAERAGHDDRIVGQVTQRTGGWIDSQEDVGGYPDLAENSRALEIPESGLRAWLREHARNVEP